MVEAGRAEGAVRGGGTHVVALRQERRDAGEPVARFEEPRVHVVAERLGRTRGGGALGIREHVAGEPQAAHL